MFEIFFDNLIYAIVLHHIYNIMIDPNCIFCKILWWEIPSVKIRENDDFVAILDAFPNRKGMTLVLSKDHYNSDIFQLDNDFLAKYMKATKEVVGLLKKWLNVEKVWLIIEWLEVDHAHIKLYPFYNWMWFQTGVWSWPQESLENLNIVANEIKDRNS